MMNNRKITEKKYCVSENSEVKTPLSSFRFSESIRFVLHFEGEERPDTVIFRIHRDSDDAMKLYTLQADGGTDMFSTYIPMRELCADENGGLFYYCYDVYYPSGCITFGGESPEILTENAERNKRQLLVYRDDFHTPAWMKGGIIYHIFVDRFCSGRQLPQKCGTLLHSKWDQPITQYPAYPGGYVANNEFYGGDLYGIADKIDYIASLGVNCIYLSPIFDAASNHKYDTGDYSRVDSMFGGDEALTYLIRKASERNIRIILDGVFNHTGADSVYFNKFGNYPSLGAVQSMESPYYPWYSFSEYPSKYTCWWDVTILPKVSCDEPSYHQYILGDTGIVAKWMNMGIGGWRLDVADELSDHFLDSLRTRVHKINKDAVIYGEVWENASNKIAYGKRRRYFGGKQLDSVMNYPLRHAVISYIRNGITEELRNCIDTIYRQYPKEVSDILMNFLGTHDTARILTELGAQSSDDLTYAEMADKHLTAEERMLALARLKIAYSLVAAMPGMPCIFYGDEAGMEGHSDPFCRRTFPWGKEDTSLREYYRQIGMFHCQTPVFRDGYVKLLCLNEHAVAVLRYNGKDKPVLLLLNRSNSPVNFALSHSVHRTDCTDNSFAEQIPPMSAIYYFASSEEIQAELRF